MDVRDLHVIDVDSHITEPADLWTSRAPAKYEDRVPHVVDVDGTPMWSFDGVLLDNRRVNLSSVIRPDGEKVPGPAFFDFELDEIHPASSDMQARLEFLDGQGIYAQVVYPNVAGFGAQKFAEVKDLELRRLCVTLFNDAMVEIQESRVGGCSRWRSCRGGTSTASCRRGRTAPPPTACAASNMLQRPAGLAALPELGQRSGSRSGRSVRSTRHAGQLPHRRERDGA